jgi:hypothetical protein
MGTLDTGLGDTAHISGVLTWDSRKSSIHLLSTRDVWTGRLPRDRAPGLVSLRPLHLAGQAPCLSTVKAKVSQPRTHSSSQINTSPSTAPFDHLCHRRGR